MRSTIILEAVKKQFDLSFSMLEKLIDKCPDGLWNAKKGGFVFWQLLLHAFSGTDYWLRTDNSKYIEPFADKRVYPELEHEPEDQLVKVDLIRFKKQVKEISEAFFVGKDDEWLGDYSSVHKGIKNIDIILVQIRHIQYHVGHCNCILRENNRDAVEWIDF